MNPLFLNPWVLAGAAVALIAAGGIGFVQGVGWNADDLAEAQTEAKTCNATLKTVKYESTKLKEQADEHKRAAESIQQKYAKTAQDLEWARTHPRVIRVRDVRTDCSAGTVRTATGDTGGTAGASGESGLGAAGSVEVTLTLEQIQDRLNKAERDSGRLYLILQRDADLRARGLVK